MNILSVDEIRENIKLVETRIEAACRRAGRERREVQLIAVSKMFPAESVAAAIAAGIRAFGENRVQEAMEKFGKRSVQSVRPIRSEEASLTSHSQSVATPSDQADPLKSLSPIDQIDQTDRTDRTDQIDCHIHLIGHLQTNKAKPAAELFDMIQSVDRLEIARKLDHHCERLNRLLPILIQVNLGNEETKSGVDPSRALALVGEVASLKQLRIRGLMTIPRFREVPEESRADFRSLRDLAREIGHAAIPAVSMNELSMGMSHDFEVAIEEGATMIRVGTAIFGKRK